MSRATLGTVALLLTLSASASVEFIENDYAKAIATAKTKNVPIFVETWAPW